MIHEIGDDCKGPEEVCARGSATFLTEWQTPSSTQVPPWMVVVSCQQGGLPLFAPHAALPILLPHDGAARTHAHVRRANLFALRHPSVLSRRPLVREKPAGRCCVAPASDLPATLRKGGLAGNSSRLSACRRLSCSGAATCRPPGHASSTWPACPGCYLCSPTW